MRLRWAGIFLAVPLAFGGPAMADDAQDRVICDGDSAPLASQVAACTRRIQRGHLSRSNLAITYYNRGLAYGRLKQRRKSIADYTQAIRLNPRDADFFNNRGVQYVNLRQYPQALKDYNHAIRLNPRHAMAYNNRGYVFEIWRNYRLALANYDRALQLNPNFATAKRNRRDLMVKIRRWQAEQARRKKIKKIKKVQPKKDKPAKANPCAVNPLNSSNC